MPKLSGAGMREQRPFKVSWVPGRENGLWLLASDLKQSPLHFVTKAPTSNEAEATAFCCSFNYD
ncbi:MAG: hypothetical protein ACI9DO_003210 [Reinekea sp.]|jgi:hypothetical protein